MFYFSIKENWINNDDGVYLRNVHIHPFRVIGVSITF